MLCLILLLSDNELSNAIGAKIVAFLFIMGIVVAYRYFKRGGNYIKYAAPKVALDVMLDDNEWDAKAYCTKAKYYLNTGNIQNAIKYFELALVRNCAYFEAHLFLGLIYSEQSQFSKAEMYLRFSAQYFMEADEKITEILYQDFKEKLGYALYYYGKVLYDKADVNKAAAFKKCAFKVAPDALHLGLY